MSLFLQVLGCATYFFFIKNAKAEQITLSCCVEIKKRKQKSGIL